jgi:hypothetical protein
MATKTKSSSKKAATIKTPMFGGTVRRANSAYFEKSGIRAGQTLTQRPFLAIRDNKGRQVIEVVDNITDLVSMPQRTKVLHQWEGKNRSDYIGYTVGNLKEYLAENPPKAGQVV